MKILVFQHLHCEHPGSFRDYMRADGIEWDTVHVDQGDAIPAFSGYDALLVMGGPQNTWESEQYPWLAIEKAAIRQWIEDENGPFLGICLGHQLLVDALGGSVGPMQRPEVGFEDVELTPEGEADRLLRGLPNPFRCLQWHGAEARSLPADGVALARNSASPIQAVRFGTMTYGLQFHLEITKTTVAEWGAVAEYREALTQTLGPDGLADFESEAVSSLPSLQEIARSVHANWVGIIRDAGQRRDASDPS